VPAKEWNISWKARLENVKNTWVISDKNACDHEGAENDLLVTGGVGGWLAGQVITAVTIRIRKAP
jgi:hypothetical protein